MSEASGKAEFYSAQPSRDNNRPMYKTNPTDTKKNIKDNDEVDSADCCFVRTFCCCLVNYKP